MFIGHSTFILRMHPAHALMYFIVAAFITNILTFIMILGLPAFPRPILSSDTTPKPSSLSLDSSEQANSEIQDSSPPPQVNVVRTKDGLTASNSGRGTNPDEPGLSPGGKFSFATIVLTFIALLVFVKLETVLFSSNSWVGCVDRLAHYFRMRSEIRTNIFSWRKSPFLLT